MWTIPSVAISKWSSCENHSISSAIWYVHLMWLLTRVPMVTCKRLQLEHDHCHKG
jgi:hypothetical protein